MAMNHHEPKTSNSPRRSASGAHPRLRAIHCCTVAGLIGRCGKRLPSDAPAASSRRRINAVRIVRSWRHTARAIARSERGMLLVVVVVISFHGEGARKGTPTAERQPHEEQRAQRSE